MLNNMWTKEQLDHGWNTIQEVSKQYNLDYYRPHFEIVTFEDMLKIFSQHMPICYEHWSFGKKYVQNYNQYKNNTIGMAAEVIFNTNPALCYLLDNNSYVLQMLVMIHAAIGHSSFNKNNYLFKEHTQPKTMLSFLQQFRQVVHEYETVYGFKNVEELLDCCHALSLNSISHNVVHPTRRDGLHVKDVDLIHTTLDSIKNKKTKTHLKNRLHEENLVKFIADNSPMLKAWQKDILKRYCYLQQYLYPQMLTKIMNEGYATFWQMEIGEQLQRKNYFDDAQWIEYLTFQSQLIHQPTYDSGGYYGFNPYNLGYTIFRDIKRICTEPTEEDKRWFPELIGKNWVEEIKYAAYNFKDSGFISQYLSPKVIRELGLFSIVFDEDKEYNVVEDIQDDEGYKNIRTVLADQHDLTLAVPSIYIEGWDPKRSRSLFLVCDIPDPDKVLLDSSQLVFKALKKLWPHPIYIKVHRDGEFSEQVEIKYD